MYDQLTPSDIKKMQEEIDHRKLVVRPQALEDVKDARAQGDLSENFEYYAAKKFKNQNESRIRYLERMIKTARVISEDSAEDEVGINNTLLGKKEGDTVHVQVNASIGYDVKVVKIENTADDGSDKIRSF